MAISSPEMAPEVHFFFDLKKKFPPANALGANFIVNHYCPPRKDVGRLKQV